MSVVNIGLLDTMRREIRRMGSRPVYLLMMVLLPLGCALFFISLMSSGLPLKTPVGVVDNDHSQLSREVIRNLNSTELLDICSKDESYHEAMEKVRQGDIFGFIVIPPDFQSDALAGRKPTLEFYSNMTYFVPGTLSFKGFKTIAVTTSAGVMRSELSYVGLTPGQIGALMQPVVITSHGIGNPWLNYSYYLTPSFSFATFALLIMLFTAYSITVEIKTGSSVQWLAVAKDRISVALTGKLIPQSIVLVAVMLCAVSIMFKYLHFPMNGSMAMFCVAIVIFVLASQSFAVLVCSALPNPRLSFSVISLLAVLTFSFAGFSFPVEDMYGAIGIFSYLMPVRYLFLIYVNTALNGFDTYFVRYYYVILLAFIPVGYLLIWRLKKACLNPVYVP